MVADAKMNNESIQAADNSSDNHEHKTALQRINEQIVILEEQKNEIDVTASMSNQIVPIDKRGSRPVSDYFLRVAGEDPRYYDYNDAIFLSLPGKFIGTAATMVTGSIASIVGVISYLNGKDVKAAGATAAICALLILTGITANIDKTIHKAIREPKTIAQVQKELEAIIKDTGDDASRTFAYVREAKTLAELNERIGLGATHWGVKAAAMSPRIVLMGMFAALGTMGIINYTGEEQAVKNLGVIDTAEQLRLEEVGNAGLSRNELISTYEQDLAGIEQKAASQKKIVDDLRDKISGNTSGIELVGSDAKREMALGDDIQGLKTKIEGREQVLKQFNALWDAEIKGEKKTFVIDGSEYTTSGKISRPDSSRPSGYSGDFNDAIYRYQKDTKRLIADYTNQIEVKGQEIRGLYATASEKAGAALEFQKSSLQGQLATEEAKLKEFEQAAKDQREWIRKGKDDHSVFAQKDPRFKPFDPSASEIFGKALENFGNDSIYKQVGYSSLALYYAVTESVYLMHALSADVSAPEKRARIHSLEKDYASLMAATLDVKIKRLKAERSLIAEQTSDAALADAQGDIEYEKLKNRAAQEEKRVDIYKRIAASLAAQIPHTEATNISAQKLAEAKLAAEELIQAEAREREAILKMATLFLDGLKDLKFDDMTGEQKSTFRENLDAHVTASLSRMAKPAREPANDDKPAAIQAAPPAATPF